jgi:threonylcarbamoyladenosine tRNA methylthiotransferase MtaB
MFENSLKIVDECGLDHLHVFPFSPREGTPAGAHAATAAGDVIKDRAKRLREAADAAWARHMQRLVGTQQTILFERGALGRAADFSLVEVAGTTAAPGDIVPVFIDGHDNSKLTAKPAFALAAE